MDGSIGQLYHNYRYVGDAAMAAATATRLDRLAQRSLADALSDKLEQALDDGQTVYIVRHVHVPLALVVNHDLPDDRIVQRWAAQLVGAIIRHVARAATDDAQVITFADQGAYVVGYITELLHARDPLPWYFQGFPTGAVSRSTEHTSGNGSAIAAVVLENRKHLSSILRHLYQAGMLERFLLFVDADTLQTMWEEGLSGVEGLDPAAVQPLVMAAIHLLDELKMWQRARPDADAVWQGFVAATTTTVDWRDRDEMTAVVVAILFWLAGEGYLKRTSGARSASGAPSLDEVDAVLRSYDWLDRDQLRNALLEVCGSVQSDASQTARDEAKASSVRSMEQTDFPARPASDATPRQKRLLDALAAALAANPTTLDLRQPLSPANALRIYTLLIDHAPEWTDDPLATRVIRQMLDVVRWLTANLELREAFRRLQLRDTSGVLRTLPAARRQGAASSLQRLMAYGDSGLRVVEALINQASLSGGHRDRSDGRDRPRSVDGLPLVSHAAAWSSPDLITQLRTNRLSLEEVRQLLAAQAASMQRTGLDQPPIQREGGSSEPQGAATPQRQTDYQAGYLDDLLDDLVDVIQMLVAADEPILSLVRALFSGPHRASQLEAVRAIAPEAKRSRISNLLTRVLEKIKSGSAQLQRQVRSEDPVTSYSLNLQPLPAESWERIEQLLVSVAALDEQAVALVRDSLTAPSATLLDVRSGIDTDCAGVFLLLRAVQDARLAGLAERLRYPSGHSLPTIVALLVTLGMRLAGSASVTGGRIDPGLALLAAAAPPLSYSDLRRAWSPVTQADQAEFQANLLQILAGQRLLRADVLHLHEIRLPNEQPALIGGDESTALWPLGQVLEANASIERILSTWLAVWHEKTGHQPIVVARPQLAQHLRNLPDLVVAVEGQEPANDEAEAAFVQAHQQSQSALASAMVALDSGQLGLPQTDLSIALLSVALLRVWARWLNRFAASSVPYLLDNFIRRAGRISMTDQIIRVEMESRPLDIVLEMAGYLATMQGGAYLGMRSVEFKIRDS